MNRAIIVTFKGKKNILSSDKLFSSLKKACSFYNLNYHTVGKSLREKNEWGNGKVFIRRLPIQ